MSDPRALLEALLRPLSELRDADGRRSYAAFLLNHRAFSAAWPSMAAVAPLTSHLVDLLAAATSPLPEPVFMRRLMSVADVYCATLVEADERPTQVEDARLCDVLDAGAAFLAAPPSATVIEAFAATEG